MLCLDVLLNYRLGRIKCIVEHVQLSFVIFCHFMIAFFNGILNIFLEAEGGGGFVAGLAAYNVFVSMIHHILLPGRCKKISNGGFDVLEIR